MKHILLGLMMLSVSTVALATGKTPDDFQAWGVLNGTYHFNDKWFGYGEFQGRYSDNLGDVRELQVKPAIGYHFTPELTGMIGYGHIEVNNGTEWLDEDRLWEQMSYKMKFGDLTLTSRTRMDHRWLSNDQDVSHRFRQQFKAEHPIFESKFYLTGSNEVLVNLNDTDTKSQGLDQNRTFGGVGYKINDNIKVETGYQLQYVPKTISDQFNNIWVTTVGFSY